MTVKELKEKIATMPDDSIVVMSCDAEGNGYSPLAEARTGKYDAETKWHGSYCAGDEDDGTTAGVPCVALWPTN